MRFFDFLSLIWSSAIMVLVFWLAGFFAWLFLVTIFDVSESWISFSLFLLFAVLGLVGGVYAGYMETKAEAHCESCNFDWVVNKNGEEHISESTKTEVVRKYGEG
ncbi:hypothetical protein N8381_06220 [Oceanospirillaceae bacterium]|nr:hypothetical protein [Oceanospirillaceae bacterium]